MNIEAKWIKDISIGNEDALKKLYDNYSTRVFNTLISYTKNPQDAEELLQDAFVTIFNTADKFRYDSSVSTWIYRITINKALDFIRKKNSQKRKGFFTSLYHRETGEITVQPVDFVHPGVTLERAESARLLFRVIDDLNENQKTAFILTQIEGLSQAEVAEIMNTTRKSVESLLGRAKVNLRAALEKHFPDRGKSSNKTSE